MTVRIGIIGPGRITYDQHGPALTRIEGAVLWSVLSRDLARAQQFADRHGAQSASPAHSDLDAMLDDPDLDAVIVATPDRLHASQTVAAAHAGKHVLVEKPMATSVEEAREMIDACNEAHRRLGIAYHLRWHAGHREMRKRMHSGELGELRHMRMHWTFKAADGTNWRGFSDRPNVRYDRGLFERQFRDLLRRIPKKAPDFRQGEYVKIAQNGHTGGPAVTFLGWNGRRRVYHNLPRTHQNNRFCRA